MAADSKSSSSGQTNTQQGSGKPGSDVFVVGRGKAHIPLEQVEITCDIPTPNMRKRVVDGKEKKYGYFSHSSISCYAKCHKLYEWTYLSGLRLDRPAPKMWLGSAIHAGLEKALRAKLAKTPVTVEEVKKEMSDILASSVTHYEGQVKEAAEAGETLPAIDWGERITSHQDYDRLGGDLLDLFMKDRFKTIKPVAIEKLFVYPFPLKSSPGTVPFTGFIDLIEEHDGEPMITDHKTGRKRTQQEVDVNDQLTLYSFAERIPAVSFESFVLGTTGGSTPKRARPAEIVKIIGRKTIKDYERVHGDFEGLLTGIKAGNFPRTGKENPMICGPDQCQYYGVCLGKGSKA